MSGSSNDTVTTLRKLFAQSVVTPQQVEAITPQLKTFLEKHIHRTDIPSTKVADELNRIRQEDVERSLEKMDGLLLVLIELVPYLRRVKQLRTWFDRVLHSITKGESARKTLVEIRETFVLRAMAIGLVPPIPDAQADSRPSLVAEIMGIYFAIDTSLDRAMPDGSMTDAQRSLDRLRSIIFRIGKAYPYDLFRSFEKPLRRAKSRFVALQLLTGWLKHEQAHLESVSSTSVVDILLACLLNDRSTSMISTALGCLVMLIPHIPAKVLDSLPAMFSVFTRCLCWERFVSGISRAQQDLVVDERRQYGGIIPQSDLMIDLKWEVVLSVPEDSGPPKLLTYFTYLYGLYPISFMDYIRKPRKYLKQASFPWAELFDLDQDVIHQRTQQFQQAHLIHPNFYNLTAQEELEDKRWLAAEPAEVMAQCLELYTGNLSAKSADKFPKTYVEWTAKRLPGRPVPKSQEATPAMAVPGTSEIQAPPRDIVKNIIREHDGDDRLIDTDDLIDLRRRVKVLQNEVDLEQWKSQQFVAAIGQMKRDRIKAMTIEAETSTLLNTNKNLQKKLDEAVKFNETLQKETQSRKTHARQSEDQLHAKIRSLRSTLTHHEDSEASLKKANEDIEALRQLVVEGEARELKYKDSIEILEDRLQQLTKAVEDSEAKAWKSKETYQALEARLAQAEARNADQAQEEQAQNVNGDKMYEVAAALPPGTHGETNGQKQPEMIAAHTEPATSTPSTAGDGANVAPASDQVAGNSSDQDATNGDSIHSQP